MPPKPKPSTISRDPYAAADPYDFIGGTPARREGEAKAAEAPPAPAKPAKSAPKPETEKITTPFPVELIERARDAAYWERATLSGIVTQALADALDRMEAERGEPYPLRKTDLRGGRPIGSGKARKA